MINFVGTIVTWNSGSSQLTLADGSGFSPGGGIGFYNNSGTYTQFSIHHKSTMFYNLYPLLLLQE